MSRLTEQDLERIEDLAEGDGAAPYETVKRLVADDRRLRALLCAAYAPIGPANLTELEDVAEEVDLIRSEARAALDRRR